MKTKNGTEIKIGVSVTVSLLAVALIGAIIYAVTNEE